MSATSRRLCVAAVVLCASAALARPLWQDDRGATLEGQAFYKNFATVTGLPGGLVEGIDALASLSEELKASLPPTLADKVPAATRLPDWVAINAHLARVSARFRFEDKVDLEAAWQVSALMASEPGFTGGNAVSGFVGGSSNVQAKRRLWDFDPALVTRPGLSVQHNLDRLALKLPLPFGDIIIGRQALSWGTGRLWNPTDLLSPFPPTVVDREVRRGFDAVRLLVALGDVTQLDLLYLPQQQAEDTGAVARFQTNLLEWDGSLSAAKYGNDVVLGADLVGDLGPLGVHAEAAWTLVFDSFRAGHTPKQTDGFVRAVAGIDWRPHDDVLLMAELHYNGFGADSPDGYLAKLQADRVVRGEVFGAGRYYAGVAASWMATDLLGLSALVLANLADPSVMLVPSLEYSFEQTVLVRFGASVPIGAGFDPRAVQRLTAADLAFQSPAFVNATRSMGLKSEYGASSLGAFLQVGLYVP